MARTDWLRYPYYQLPDPGLVDVPLADGIHKMASAEYNLALAISQDIRSCRNGYAFLSAQPDPQYRNPKAYRDNLIEYAKTLTQFTYSKYIVPGGWDPVEAGTRYTNILCDTLKNIAVNENYPESNNVYDAWIDGTGSYYGGVRP